MKKRYNFSFDINQIQRGIFQCTETAYDLFKAAETLGKKGLLEIACSLLMLSSEELGKAVLIYRSILLEDDDEEGWKKFWDEFYSHSVKLTAGQWQWAENFFNLYWDSHWGKTIKETQKDHVRFCDDLKQRGFYTFFDEKKGIFRKTDINILEYSIMKLNVKLRLREIMELKNAGFFKISILSKLKKSFSQDNGQELLKRYIKENKLKTSPELESDYKEFLKSTSFTDIEKMQRKAIHVAVTKVKMNFNPTLRERVALLIRLLKREWGRSFRCYALL